MRGARISLKEVAKLTGYHPDYISYLIRNKKIDAEKIGRNWFTTKEEVQSYLSTKKYLSAGTLLKRNAFVFIVLVMVVVGLGAYYYMPQSDTRLSSKADMTIPDEDVPLILNQ